MKTEFYDLLQRHKDLANQGNLNAADHLAYALARALYYAESDGEAGYLAGKYVLQTFQPVKNKRSIKAQCNNDPYFRIKNMLRTFGSKTAHPGCLEGLSDEAKDAIKAKARHVLNALDCNYVYIFVRTDLPCKEQVVVQAAHATFVAGDRIRSDYLNGKFDLRNYNPAHTHFVILGVEDLFELEEVNRYAEYNDLVTYPFYEGDLDDEMTAFATQPIQQAQRGLFKSFALLKFQGEE